MAVLGIKSTVTRQVSAFLDLIAWAEGTASGRHPTTRFDGYDVIVTGMDGKAETFLNFADHPFSGGRAAKVFSKSGLRSSASGRYQQIVKYWPAYKAQLKLPDFSPLSQDLLAIQLIKECRALDDIEAGRFSVAVHKCRSRWASLPGAGYGQLEHKLAALEQAYIDAGGVIA